MFCVASLEPPLNISFKVPDDKFDELTQQPSIIPAPYMARAKWVRVVDQQMFQKADWENHIRESYNLVKAKLTKKLRQDLGI
jgi:predicted DNA-binding protein (MmcQ/YjbR family)